MNSGERETNHSCSSQIHMKVPTSIWLFPRVLDDQLGKAERRQARRGETSHLGSHLRFFSKVRIFFKCEIQKVSSRKRGSSASPCFLSSVLSINNIDIDIHKIGKYTFTLKSNLSKYVGTYFFVKEGIKSTSDQGSTSLLVRL